MRRGIGRLRVGGSIGFSPSSISFTSGLWLDPSDISTGFQDSAGTTPQTASGQPTGKRLDKSGRANHVTQATAGFRPEYDVISSISSDFFDGSDDAYATGAFAAGTLTAAMDCFIAIKRASALKGIIASPAAAGAAFFGAFDSASGAACYSTCGTPTHLVNGVAVPGGTATTRLQLDTALTTGSWCVLEVRDLDLSGALWTAFQVGMYGGGWFLSGDLGGIILCPVQSTANRAALRKWLGAKVGLSL